MVSTTRELVRQADAIGLLEVLEVASSSTNDEGGPMTNYSVSLMPIRVLKGSLPADTSVTVVTDDTCWSPELDDTKRDWLEPGYQVLLALHRCEDTGQLRPLSSQAIFAIDGDKLRSVWMGQYADQLDGTEVASLEQAISKTE